MSPLIALHLLPSPPLPEKKKIIIHYLQNQKKAGRRIFGIFVLTYDKVLTIFFFFITRIYFLCCVENGEKNQIMGRKMETILAINLPFFSIYWNRELARSWNAVCICVSACFWTFLTNVRSDIFLISVYIKRLCMTLIFITWRSNNSE